MIIDVCTYNGEKDLWDIHYNVLKDVVDQFIVVEFDKTFSGKPKDPTFPIKDYPVKHFFHTEADYGKYYEMAETSPNTKGAAHWKTEFAQKESLKDTLTGLRATDVVFIGDVDEIWEPKPEYTVPSGPQKLMLKVYTYWLNNRSSEVFHGTLRAQYRDIEGQCLNHLRSDAQKGWQELGWHFTSMGGYDSVKKKLSDSYTRESYWTEDVEASLRANIDQGNDFLGRSFTYHLEEETWPQYLKDNKNKYQHLLK